MLAGSRATSTAVLLEQQALAATNTAAVRTSTAAVTIYESPAATKLFAPPDGFRSSGGSWSRKACPFGGQSYAYERQMPAGSQHAYFTH